MIINKNESVKDENGNLENTEPSKDELKEEIKSDSINITVTPSDCDKGCEKFKKEEELEYCQQICGITTYYDYSEDESQDEFSEENDENNDELENDCNNETGLQKDYCLKDNAIDEENFKLCDLISDSGIKKTCQNRIMEAILEQQSAN